ncbi:hypothetical protein [Spirochaeta dissipatitropha]
MKKTYWLRVRALLLTAMLLFSTAALLSAEQASPDSLFAEIIFGQNFGQAAAPALDSAENFPNTDLRGRLGLMPEGDGFSFVMDVAMRNDGRYRGSHGEEFYGSFYETLIEGGMGYRFRGLQARAGRFFHDDALDSPYSLFINSRDISSFLYEIQYDGGFFYAESRTVELNRNSDHGFPDRGLTYQNFALRYRGWELGYQDAIVSVAAAEQQTNGDDPDEIRWRQPPPGDGTGPYFVPEYFFNPIPSFLLQYGLGSGSNPWRMDKNHTTLMGVYLKYTADTWEAMGQWLVDDINMNRFLNPDSFQNPDKMGWMIGGRMQTDYGRFGLWHAGAHRYTFQPYGSGSDANPLDRMYGYTYYPDTRYPAGGGNLRSIANRENQLGLYLGENSMGFRLDWDHVLEFRNPELPALLRSELELAASAEFTLTGSQSPANPWGEYLWWREHHTEGTRWLDDDVLEKGYLGSLQAVWNPAPQRFGRFSLTTALNFGWLQNVLQLEAPREIEGMEISTNPVNQRYIWYPSDDNHGFVQIHVGIRYSFGKEVSRVLQSP